MKTLVLGAGAMGSLFGTRLKNNGHEVLLVDLWEEHVNKINSQGLKVIEKDGEESITKIDIVSDVSKVTGTFELIIVFVKGYVTEVAMKSVMHLIDDKTIVLTLQNGIGNGDNVAKLVPSNQIAVGGTSYGGGVIEAGYVAHRAWGPTHIGPFGKEYNFEKLEEIAEIFTSSSIETKALHDVSSVIWTKLMINIAYNGLTSITRLKNYDMTKTDEGKNLIRSAVEEALEVAESKGIHIHFDDPVEECIRQGLEDIANNKSSMLQDIVKQRKSEIDTINGAISKLGFEEGIPTPTNDMITALIKIIEKNYENIVFEI